MHLKSLTILGFKSFADRTALGFQPGITCIVGPNGCGKSNVADAIRWVLGEQSAKALRGGEMADVIFNGTDGRKPLAMAEVSLTISDVAQDHLKAAGVELPYHEVTVTRRVFRDGGSEYFINRTPCRLRDIQQLFMGTGVGRASYSIMAQGNITQILSSKPEERRMVFEEAAGITKFKAQKREALRKLEYTEQNLLRVSDLIREVKRQIGSLQRQAGKARRYRQIQQELQHLETQLARHQFDVLQGEIAAHEASIGTLRAQIEETSARVMRDEDEIAGLRERLTDLEHQVSQSQQQGLELRNQIERHEHRIHFNEERQRELETQHGAALAEIAQAEERRSLAESELATLRQSLETAQSALARNRETLQSRQETLRAVEQTLAARQASIREAQSSLFAAAQGASRLRNEITALDLQKQGNLVRLDKLASEKIQLEEERSRAEQHLQTFTANVESEKQNAQSRRLSLEEQQQRLREIQTLWEQAGRELSMHAHQQAGLRSHLAVLEQLQTDHEGFSAGALAALQHTRQALGSLADRIRVPDPYVAAIEAALGHHLQLVLTAEPLAAHEILEHLASGRKGRASLAALSLQPMLPEEPEPAATLVHGEAALKLVEADDAVQPLLRRLLGRTRVVANLAAATEAWCQGSGAWDYVTLAGELLSRHGVYTGGSSAASDASNAPASILGRKNQIVGIQSQLAILQERIAEASRLRGNLQGEQTQLQAVLQAAQSDLRAREVAIATHEGEVTALRNALRILHQKIDTVVFEVQSLAAQAEEAQQRRTSLATQLATLEDQERAFQAQLDDHTRALETSRQEREAATAALTEVRVQLAADEQHAGALERQRAPLQARIHELVQTVDRRRADISGCIQRRAQADAEIAESQQKIDALQHQREQVSQQTASLLAQRDALGADIAGRDEALREFRRVLSERQQQRGGLEIELAQKNMGLANLAERIHQKYQVNLTDVRSECITITHADQGPARVETLSPEAMAAAGASTDWNAVADQVAAMEQRLAEMGPVNLVAIEEYEETEQRYQFLTGQYNDLTTARTELNEVLNRINTQTKTMFVETFEKIRDNFRSMFTEVFGGGKADLRLVDEGDVLESGIDIMARPPGKQLQTISLLSGGEQTMTAVALLFAIYQVKPSPFCVLDELDAPLDESNINRFIRILQRFLAHSQFIIITHNKRTIGMGDVLYGVTMEEQGVSSIVSVKFHKADAAADGRPTSLLMPSPAAHSVEEEEDAVHSRNETLELQPAP